MVKKRAADIKNFERVVWAKSILLRSGGNTLGVAQPGPEVRCVLKFLSKLWSGTSLAGEAVRGRFPLVKMCRRLANVTVLP